MARAPDTNVVHGVPDGGLADVVRLLRSTGWAAAREEAGVRRMLDHSDVVVCLVRADGTDPTEVLGFARVLTDYEYRAFIEDVVVSVPYRGRGLGTRLVRALCTHPDLVDVEQLVLECRQDLVDFYARFGFEPVPDTGVLLKRVKTSVDDGTDREQRQR